MKVSHKGRRVKGAKFERRVVAELQEAGVGAEKVPLSGSVKGSKFDHDISVPVRGVDQKLECKIKAGGDGFKKLYGWLAGNYAVCVCMDRSDALVVLRLTDFAQLAALPPAALTDVLQPSRLPFRVLSKDEVEAA
jgi:hypothetical protein